MVKRVFTTATAVIFVSALLCAQNTAGSSAPATSAAPATSDAKSAAAASPASSAAPAGSATPASKAAPAGGEKAVDPLKPTENPVLPAKSPPPSDNPLPKPAPAPPPAPVVSTAKAPVSDTRVFPVPAHQRGQFFFALGADVNQNAREGFAFGATVNFGFDTSRSWAAGVLGNLSYNFDPDVPLYTIEGSGFARYYIGDFGSAAVFTQLDAGVSIFKEAGNTASHDDNQAMASVLAGGTLGIRFGIGRSFYIEPFGRAGYPFVWGAGLTLGFRAPGGKPVDPKSYVEYLDAVQVQKDLDEIKARISELAPGPGPTVIRQRIVLYFGPNTSDLPKDITLALADIARALNADKNLRLLVDGYANPVSANPTAADRIALERLARERAEKVAESLVAYGISRNRMVLAVSGGTVRTVPDQDHDKWAENRRVELTIIE